MTGMPVITTYATSSKTSHNFSNYFKTDCELSFRWDKDKNVDHWRVYMYYPEKGKYFLEGETKEKYFYKESLESDTEYKFCLRGFDVKGKIISTEFIRAKTLSPRPFFITSTVGDKCTVTLNAAQKDANGYEIYYAPTDLNHYNPNIRYHDVRTADELKYKRYKLLERKTGQTSCSFALKGMYNLIARTFKTVNGKRIYSHFTDVKITYSPESYLNALQLKPVARVSGEEYEIVKKYINEWITPDMTNCEKFEKIYKEVHYHGKYQYDYSKVDGTRNVWQIMVKGEGQCAQWAFCCQAMMEYVGFDIRVVRGTRGTGRYTEQHFWCQIKLNDEWYDFDPHISADYINPNAECDHYGYKIQEHYD